MATHPIVMGDKSSPELYALYNDGCVVDLAEERMGKGGGDLCIELKVWNSLVAADSSSRRNDTTYHGGTHAFGNTEERAIHRVLGVKGRDGDERWESMQGVGHVTAHDGDYHDAQHVKRNTVELRLHNLFGGFAPGSARGLRDLSKRTIDRTLYENRSATDFATYWAQRISAAIVLGDARRCLRRFPALRRRAADAAQRTAQRTTSRRHA